MPRTVKAERNKEVISQDEVMAQVSYLIRSRHVDISSLVDERHDHGRIRDNLQ